MGRLDLRDPVRDEDLDQEVEWELLRNHGRRWVRCRVGEVKTSWHLFGRWSEELRAQLLAELDRLRAPAL